VDTGKAAFDFDIEAALFFGADETPISSIISLSIVMANRRIKPGSWASWML